MGFPKALLADHERLVLETRPHWIALVLPAFWTVVAVAAMILIPWDGTAGLVTKSIVLAGWLLLAILPFLQWRFTFFVLTSDRLITRRGVIAKSSKEIPLERINDVSFNQSIFERMVGAGDLLIESAGERGQERITDVRHPEQMQLTIYKEAEENSNRMMRGGAEPARQSPDIPEQIAALARLKDQGVLSETEFEAKKQDLLRRL
ncbi:MAG: PH domain-containing protein [Actinomycetota bacterium]